jgi:hypothetical protein
VKESVTCFGVAPLWAATRFSNTGPSALNLRNMAKSKEMAVAAAKAASEKRKAQEAKHAAKRKAAAHLIQSKANRHPTAGKKRPRVTNTRSAVPEPEEAEEEEDEDDEAAEDANDSDANGNGGAGQREDAAGASDDASTDSSLENARQV